MENNNAADTRSAFQNLISTRNWYKDLGIKEGTAWSYAARFEKNELTINKMEEILMKAGYKVVQEKLWAK